MRRVILYMIIITLASCAGSKKHVEKPKDLVESFKISGEKFEKFKIATLDEQPEKKEQIEALGKKATVKAKNNSKVHKETKRKRRKRKVAVLKKKKRKSIVKKKSVYPEDYPKNFIKYDSNSEKLWKKFSPVIFPGEQFVFKIKYFGVTVGNITIESRPVVKIANRVAYHIFANLKSAKFYDFVYSLDDNLNSYFDVNSFLPIKYSLIQRESGQDVDDLQLFDPDSLKTHIFYKRLKKGKIKEFKKSVYVPRFFQDYFSTLYFVRGLPLKKGDKYTFPLISKGKLWLIDITVDGDDTVWAVDKKVKAVKLIGVGRRVTEKNKRNAHVVFWYSKDSERKLLRFEAKIKLGSITGELENYDIPQK